MLLGKAFCSLCSHKASCSSSLLGSIINLPGSSPFRHLSHIHLKIGGTAGKNGEIVFLNSKAVTDGGHFAGEDGGCGGTAIGVISRLGEEEKEQFPLKNSTNGKRSHSLVTPRECHGMLQPAESQPKPWLQSTIQLTQSIP